jgi:CheY-like chemotaxis protein
MATPVRVLLVDEDDDVLAVTREFLEHENDGFEVETATSAADALDRLDTQQFDAVVTDYRMPRTDGLTLAGEIRDRHPDVPVVLFTAHQDEAFEREIEAIDLTSYVAKRTGTDQYDELAATIRESLAD